MVVAFAETHGRPQTAALLDGLEVIPRKKLTYRGATFEEMDIDAVLARKPQIALVDELAHTNVPGSRHEKRWQDVEELLDAGIDVISAVNIQHLESLNDVVEQITGVPQRETVPDAVVRAADQVELVDMTAEALRRRMAHGNIYPPEKIDAALTNYFRAGNLTALRELALLWLADKVDEGLQKYRAEHDITTTWEARERVVVALTGGPEGDTLIRRAARIAARSTGGDLLAVHVTKSDGLTGANPANLARQRQLVESLGGTYHQVVGDNISDALLTFARAENATQLVLGASRRSWLLALLTGPGIGSRTIRDSGAIDVHIVTHAHAGSRWGCCPGTGAASRARRQVAGYVLAGGARAAADARARQPTGPASTSPATCSSFLVAVIAVALTGGFVPALLEAIAASLLLNYYFTPPIHQWTIAEANNALALGVFVAVGLVVSWVVDIAARRTNQAARGQRRVGAARDHGGSASCAARARSTRCSSGSGRPSGCARPACSSARAARPARGPARPPTGPSSPASGETPGRAGPRTRTWTSRSPTRCRSRWPAARCRPSDRRVLGAFAAYAAVALEQQRLAAEAEAAKPIAAADRMRTALLAAVSHDLRTPLASAKAAVTSLRSPDMHWDAADTEELLATADESLDRLTHLVEQPARHVQAAGGRAVAVPAPVRARRDRRPRARRPRAGSAATSRWTSPSRCPRCSADPAILERVVVNLTENALRYSPAGKPPLLAASALGDRVELRVVDRGPGIPEDGQGAHVRAVPAARRHRQHHRRRARPRARRAG